jgi:hypothetical protein
MHAGILSWDITESLQYKITSDYPKKTVAIPKIGVIFLALPWSRD